VRALLASALLMAAESRAQDGGWTLAATSGPSARAFAEIVFDDVHGRVVLFGGAPSANAGIGDTWYWDGATWTLAASPAAEPNGAYCATAFDSARGVMVLVGGQYTQETWEWDGGTWTQVADGGPPPGLWMSAMAYDSLRHRSVLFGGMAVATPAIRGDTWSWDGVRWQLLTTTGPPARYGHLMAYDAYRDRVLVFGGNASAMPLTDTWEFDGVSWSEIADAGPDDPYPAMAFDRRTGWTLLFGEATAPASSEVWKWDGASWTPLIIGGPPPRESISLAYDSVHQQLVMFGGSNGLGYLGDTWTLVVPGPSYDGGPIPDAGVADAGRPDAGVADAGTADAGATDAGAADGGHADAGPPTDQSPGTPAHYQLGCATAFGPSGLVVVLLFAVWARRHRRA
jgi:hypothetical protein